MVIVPRRCLSCRAVPIRSTHLRAARTFGYLGNGTQLALCNENWLELQESVLVPDPVVYEPVVNIGKTGLLCEPHVSCKTVT